MKTRICHHLLCLLFPFLVIPVAHTQIVYYANAGSALIQITVDGGNCTMEVIGFIPAPGTTQAIAICGDGQLYITTNLGGIYSLDINTMQTTLIANSPAGYIVALTCSPSGLLYAGTSDGLLITIDPGIGGVTVLGPLPYPPQDMVFFNGSLYMSTANGIVLVDTSNPPASTFLFNTPTSMWGLSVGPECGTLFGSTGGNMTQINIGNESSTPYCSNIYGLLDLTSASEFSPPGGCLPELDLDDDDSSGASGADFNTEQFDCLTVGGLNIADTDVVVSPVSSVMTMTITLTGDLDAPSEYLVLNNPPAGITVAGSGTTSITLTNAANASASDFEQALQSILYFNDANPFTPGLRLVLVSFVNTEGQSSNTATAHLMVVELPPVFIDLGPDVGLCAGESVTLDAGIPGATYLWNTNATTQTITVNLPGNYSVTVTNGLDCPNAGSVQVNVFPNQTVELNGSAAICPGETALLTISSTYPQPLEVVLSASNGTQYTLLVPGVLSFPLIPSETTTYTLFVPVPPANNCLLLGNTEATVSVLPTDSTFSEAFICAGDSIFLAGIWQQTPGIYTQHATNVYGCDSSHTTVLEVIPSVSVQLDTTTCDPALAGVDTIIFQAVSGCDSVVITHTALLPTDTTFRAAASCSPADTGVFYQRLTNVLGCDSVLVTTVALLPTDTTFRAAASCSPADTGVFYQTLTNVFGCDSVLVTTVGLLPSDTTVLFTFSCSPTDTGVYYQALTNTFGCDSLVIRSVVYVAPDTTRLFDQTCFSAEAGDFIEYLTNAAGCDSVVITTVALAPSDTVLLFETSCNPASTGVFYQHLFNTAGCDSTVVRTVTFSQSDTTLFFATTCDPTQSGIFSQLLTTPEGCDSLIITSVSLLPSDSTQVISNTCDSSAAGLFVFYLTNQYGCDSVVLSTIRYIKPDTTLIAEATCDPALAGVFLSTFVNQYGCDSSVIRSVALLPSDTIYRLHETCVPDEVGTVVSVTTNQFGCDSTVVTTTSLFPYPTCDLDIAFTGETLTCRESVGTLLLWVINGLAPFNFEVRQAGILVASGVISDTGAIEQVANLPVGVYTVVVTSVSGITAMAQTAIDQDPTPQVDAEATSQYGAFGVSCQGALDGSAEAIGSGGTAPYVFLWSTGASGGQVDGLPAGFYTVTLTDANNCIDTAWVELTEPPKLEVSLSVNNPDCFDQNFGMIIVDAQGGASPYEYSLNGSAFEANGQFTNLSPGLYTIVAQDANGCEAAEILAINAPVPVAVELGDNIRIELGDSATLHALVNLPFDSLASVTWTGLGQSECLGCLTQVVFPVITTTYTIRVVDANGCSDEDNLRVDVDRKKSIYAPNVFSPNGDGQNDIFTLFPRPNSVVKIHSFTVFSRWGEMVYLHLNLPPGDPAIGWDGTHGGEPLNPAVFVWYAIVEFTDGETEVFKGDVTLVR